MFNRKTLALLFALIASPVSAQVVNPGVQQSGAVTTNNCVKWGPGVGQIQDAGTACAAGTTPGGANGNVQFNNAGTFGGYTNAQLTALVQVATATTSGAIPLIPNTTTTFLRGDNSFATLNCAALSGVAASCGTDATNATNITTGTLSLSRLALASALIYVGNGSNVPAAVALSGDCTITNAGVITCTKTGGVAFAASATTDATVSSNVNFTPANPTPQTASVQTKLRAALPVMCEDYVGGCTAANIQAAMIYAANNNHCYMGAGSYSVTTTISVTKANGVTGTPCISGNFSIVGPASGTLTAVLEFKNVTDVQVLGNLKVDCNNNAYTTSAVKFWSDNSPPGSNVQYNFPTNVEYANCRQGIVYGDVTRSTLPISEISTLR